VGHEGGDFFVLHVLRRVSFQPGHWRMGHGGSDYFILHVLLRACFQPGHWRVGHGGGDYFGGHVSGRVRFQSDLVLEHDWQDHHLYVLRFSRLHEPKRSQVCMHCG
jgi:hypothetical protein